MPSKRATLEGLKYGREATASLSLSRAASFSLSQKPVSRFASRLQYPSFLRHLQSDLFEISGTMNSAPYAKMSFETFILLVY